MYLWDRLLQYCRLLYLSSRLVCFSYGSPGWNVHLCIIKISERTNSARTLIVDAVAKMAAFQPGGLPLVCYNKICFLRYGSVRGEEQKQDSAFNNSPHSRRLGQQGDLGGFFFSSPLHFISYSLCRVPQEKNKEEAESRWVSPRRRAQPPVGCGSNEVALRTSSA